MDENINPYRAADRTQERKAAHRSLLGPLPVWSAYIIAPAFILLVSLKTVARSDVAPLIVAFAVGSGLVCAAVLHGYLATKRWLASRRRRD